MLEWRLMAMHRNRWVAATPFRYEYARLAQRRRPRLEQRQWVFQFISRPLRALHADINAHIFRLLPAADSTNATAHAERERP